jgi:hypothetical protein
MAKKTKPVKKKGGTLWLAFVVLGIAGLFVLPLSMIVVVGFIPTIAMACTDKSRGRSVTVAVGALNMVGVTYLVIQLIQKGLSFDYALRLLSDPVHWLIMWGGAGLGYTLLYVIPPIVAHVLTSVSEFKIQKLKTNQDEIKKTWGKDVAEEVKSEE